MIKPMLQLYVRSLPRTGLRSSISGAESGTVSAGAVVGTPVVGAGGPGAMGGRRTEVPAPVAGAAVSPETDVQESVSSDDRTLPDDQAHCVAYVRAAADRHGFALHVVDLASEWALHERLEELIHGHKELPVLLSPDGDRLEGVAELTPARIDHFLER